MIALAQPPRADARIVDDAGLPTPAFYRFLTSSARIVPAPIVPATNAMIDLMAAGYGIDNTGSTVTLSALQTAINAVSAAGEIAYIRQGTYEIGVGSLSVPDYCNLVLHPNAILQRSTHPTVYTTSSGMLNVGSNCTVRGGQINNSAVDAVSTSTVTIGLGNLTFQVPAGGPWSAGMPVRCWSTPSPANSVYGTVASYSGTTLVVTSLDIHGTGAFSAWSICQVNAWMAAAVLHSAVSSVIEGVRVNGNHYVGIMMEAVNPPAGGALITRQCRVVNCIVGDAAPIMNRSFYAYGNVADCQFTGCVANCAQITDYGFNFNASNVTGSANSILRTNIVQCSAISARFQGFEFGDATDYCVIANSCATAVGNTGFLVQAANAGIPQYNSIVGCIAVNSGINGFYISGAIYNNLTGCEAVGGAGIGYLLNNSQLNSITGCRADGNATDGFLIEGSSSRNDLNGIAAVNNAGYGVHILSGVFYTSATGRAYNNTTANVLDAGTGSVLSVIQL